MLSQSQNRSAVNIVTGWKIIRRLKFSFNLCWTNNAYLFLSCNIYMCIQSENYGDFRQCVIPVTITSTLQGTPCNTGISHTFYGENICSAVIIAGLSYKLYMIFPVTGKNSNTCKNSKITLLLSQIFPAWLLVCPVGHCSVGAHVVSALDSRLLTTTTRKDLQITGLLCSGFPFTQE